MLLEKPFCQPDDYWCFRSGAVPVQHHLHHRDPAAASAAAA
jgi:hypothetical protein